MLLKAYTWLNPPPKHSYEGSVLHVETGKETDFWRETFYGFWRDSGHFLFSPVAGDFTAEVTVEGRYEVLYDQAGLMIRLSESHWIKAGIEYTDGVMYFFDRGDERRVGLVADQDTRRRRRENTRHPAS